MNINNGSTYQPIEFDGEDGIWIAVVAYFGASFEVEHLKLPRWGEADECYESAWEQSLNNKCIFLIYNLKQIETKSIMLPHLNWILFQLGLATESGNT